MSEPLILGAIGALGEEHFFSARLPSRFTSKTFAQNKEAQKWLQQGLIEANALSLVMISLLAIIAKDWRVFIFPLIILIILNILYLNDFGVINLW